MKKSKKIRLEEITKQFLEIFDELPEHKKSFVKSLIDRAAFLIASLQDLEAEINDKGHTETYQNGENQMGVKQSEAVKTHIAFAKNLSVIMRQLYDFVPAVKNTESKMAAFQKIYKT
ncbi:MAG: hypothetical protein LBI38_07090 [Oscillospiraceae bacterium]|jgi:hypothetical protein|nr:hypothetical protein [Oscillospiraceae bacterium]